MSVEVPVLEVVVLADRLRSAAVVGHEAAARLAPVGGLGELTWVVEAFLGCVSLAARGTAVETEVLGTTVAGVAESWMALDGVLLTRRQQVRAR